MDVGGGVTILKEWIARSGQWEIDWAERPFAEWDQQKGISCMRKVAAAAFARYGHCLEQCRRRGRWGMPMEAGWHQGSAQRRRQQPTVPKWPQVVVLGIPDAGSAYSGFSLPPFSPAVESTRLL